MNLLTEKASKTFIWIGLIVLLIGFFLFLYNETLELSSKIKADKVGQLGDFIGGISGALWALAGVILFYVALEKQKESLKMQIEEFELQRQELIETRKVFKEQNKTQLISQYETSFYNLINLLQKIVTDFKYQTTQSRLVKQSHYVGDTPNEQRIPDEYQHVIVDVLGREFISKIYNDILKEFSKIKEGNPDSTEEILTRYYDKYAIYLRPYFNIILQLLIKIDICPLDNKLHYKDVFEAILTEDEVRLITFYRKENYIDSRLDELFKKYYS